MQNTSDPSNVGGTPDGIRARDTLVNGHPERVPSLGREEGEAQVRDLTARLRKAARGDDQPLPLDKIPAIMFTMAPFPDLFEKLSQLSIHLLGPNSVLPKRERELAILRTGWLLGAPFEWGEHVYLSKMIGITSDEIERVTIGSTAPEWSERERAVLAAAEELRAEAIVGDATWATLGRHFDDHQRVELLFLIGQFTNVAYFQNTLRLQLEPYNVGLGAR